MEKIVFRLANKAYTVKEKAVLAVHLMYVCVSISHMKNDNLDKGSEIRVCLSD